MGNWMTVNMTGSMTEQDAAALREYLGYSLRARDDPAWDRFGPLSFSRDQPSLCGLNDWPAATVSRNGNVAEELATLVKVAGSMLLTVHCGGDYESLDCVATIRVGEGLVSLGKPEVARIGEIGDDQAVANMFRALSGGY